MSRNVVITGLPRSGTSYMSRVFRSMGLDSKHEGTFLAGRKFKGNIASSIECSYAAVPYLHMLKDVVIVHQIRNPILVIQSMLNKNMMNRPDDNPFVSVVKIISPRAYEGNRDDNEIQRACHLYMDWNRKINSQLSHVDESLKVFHKVEEPKIMEILKKADIPMRKHKAMTALNDVSKTTNDTRWDVRFEISREDLTEEVVNYCIKLNYME